MSQCRVLIIFVSFLFVSAATAHAGAMLYRVQQMQAQKKRQNEAQYQQYQQGQNQEGEAENQEATAQQTYQQAVDDRNQALAKAIFNARNSNVSTNETNAVDGQDQQEAFSAGVQQGLMPTTSNVAQDTVDLTDVWKKLDKKSTVWPLLMDDQAKLLTMSEYIGRFQKEGVKINQPPAHYAQMMDEVVKENPQMLQRPFGELLQMLAIIEYDFDNGMDKDALAKAVLGEAGYESNKQRFSQQK